MTAEYSQASLEVVPMAQMWSTIAKIFGETFKGAVVGQCYPGNPIVLSVQKYVSQSHHVETFFG